MTREERIARFEEILNRTNRIAGELENALDAYDGIHDEIAALADRYASPLWMEDYEADCAGLLPKDLKHGVLSEDGIADALDRIGELAERLRGYSAPARAGAGTEDPAEPEEQPGQGSERADGLPEASAE